MLPFRTNEIKLNVPPKVLGGSITSTSVAEFWIYGNGSGDKWWIAGSSPKGWKYELTINITKQQRDSRLTRKPFR